jgi:hypothetical protein
MCSWKCASPRNETTNPVLISPLLSTICPEYHSIFNEFVAVSDSAVPWGVEALLVVVVVARRERDGDLLGVAAVPAMAESAEISEDDVSVRLRVLLGLLGGAAAECGG